MAAGIVAIGHAGDGGPIRLPASTCGLVGLKPSRDLVPTYPDIDPWGGLVARLGVTRTVADTALLMDVLAGPDPLAAAPTCSAFSGGYVEALSMPPEPLRIAWTTATPGGSHTHPAVGEVVESTASMLADEGHLVEEATPSILTDEAFFGQAMGWFMDAFAVWVRRSVDDLEAMGGEPIREADLEPHTWALRAMGADVPGPRFAAAVDGLMRVGRRVRSFLEDQPYDVLLTPTCPEVPWPLGGFTSQTDNPLAAVMRAADLVTYASPFNISGQPAISLPVAEVQGLPVGAQLVGGWGSDHRLLAIAARLESRLAWQDRRPPNHVAAG
ncbi:MAG: amidase [Microthrixaceae bacterium]